MMTDIEPLKIRANQIGAYKLAYVGDCVYTTYPGDRHTPVMHGIAGTVTTRPGELAVVVLSDSDHADPHAKPPGGEGGNGRVRRIALLHGRDSVPFRMYATGGVMPSQLRSQGKDPVKVLVRRPKPIDTAEGMKHP